MVETKQPTLILATPQDDAELSEFYSSSLIRGPVDIRLNREGSFFGFYRLQSDQFDTYLLRNSEKRIMGMATIIYRQANLNGKKELIGYCTDLRVSPSREAIQAWTRHFLPLLQRASAERGALYFFSTIGLSQKLAQNTLIRPRSERRQLPRYYLLNRFELITVHGRIPLAPPPVPTIRLRPAEQQDLGALASFLQRKTESRPLSYTYSVDFLLDRIKRWPDFELSDFILALDSKGNIIGSVAPWNPSKVQSISIIKYRGFSASLKTVIGLGALMGLTRRMPKAGDKLNIEVLTHFQADNPDIFYSLLYQVYKTRKKVQAFTYAHSPSEPLTLPPRSFVTTSLPYAVYTVLPPTTPLPDFLKVSRQTIAPELELALM